MATCEEVNDGGGMWLIDSGCSNHMTGNKGLFQQLRDVQNQSIKLGDGKSLQVSGIGSIALYSNSGRTCTLTNVKFVHDLAHNLLSVGQLMNSGYMVEFAEGVCTIRDAASKERIAHVNMTSHRLFPLEADDVGNANVAMRAEELSDLWHKRFGHLNQKSLRSLCNLEMVTGFPSISTIEPCEICSLGKQNQNSFPDGEARTETAPLELIHADLVGPMQTPNEVTFIFSY